MNHMDMLQEIRKMRFKNMNNGQLKKEEEKQGSVGPPRPKLKERGFGLRPSPLSFNIVKSGQITCYKIGLFYLLLTSLSYWHSGR